MIGQNWKKLLNIQQRTLTFKIFGKILKIAIFYFVSYKFILFSTQIHPKILVYMNICIRKRTIICVTRSILCKVSYLVKVYTVEMFINREI